VLQLLLQMFYGYLDFLWNYSSNSSSKIGTQYLRTRNVAYFSCHNMPHHSIQSHSWYSHGTKGSHLYHSCGIPAIILLDFTAPTLLQNTIRQSATFPSFKLNMYRVSCFVHEKACSYPLCTKLSIYLHLFTNLAWIYQQNTTKIKTENVT